MSEPLRILVRLVGLVLFVGSVVGVVVIVALGPDEVGEKMGKSCRHTPNGPSQWCTWQDALGILGALPWICLVGAVLLVVMQRGVVGRGKEQRTEGGPRFASLRAAGGLLVVVLVIANFVGVFVLRAGYAVAEIKDVHDKLSRDEPRPDAPKRRSAPAAPRGLAEGSLLRADRFRSALAELRRAAPAGARLSSLRVAADRIDAEVLAGGRVIELRKPWDGRATVVSAEAATDGDDPLATFAGVDPAAPQRVARAAARRPRDVDYLVLFDAAGLRWNAFLVEGKGMVSASPDGRRLL